MKITPLKMWVQNVLPVVYDDSLSYYEMVGKINEKTNEIINQVNENTDGIEALNKIIEQLGDVDELKALLEQVETIVNDLYTTDVPAMDSENGSAGVAEHAARSDHSHPSDNSKADADLGITGALAGQYVRIKTVEGGVPTEFENYTPHEVPSGGTTGQALRKESNADYAAEWSDVHDMPSGGTTGQALKKNSSTDYDARWSDTHEIPSGGNKDNILIKNSNTNNDAKWTSTPAQMESLAHINAGNTADRAYNIGDYLVYNGQLYRVVNTNISSGESLVPNTNISAVPATTAAKNEANAAAIDAVVVIDYNINNVTIGSNGYVSVGSYKPTTPSGYGVLFFTIMNATYSGNYQYPIIDGRGNYVCGSPDFTYTELNCRAIFKRV